MQHFAKALPSQAQIALADNVLAMPEAAGLFAGTTARLFSAVSLATHTTKASVRGNSLDTRTHRANGLQGGPARDGDLALLDHRDPVFVSLKAVHLTRQAPGAEGMRFNFWSLSTSQVAEPWSQQEHASRGAQQAR